MTIYVKYGWQYWKNSVINYLSNYNILAHDVFSVKKFLVKYIIPVLNQSPHSLNLTSCDFYQFPPQGQMCMKRNKISDRKEITRYGRAYQENFQHP